MPLRKKTKNNKRLAQKLTTRLMHLNFVVEDYIYNHKAIPVPQAKLYVNECESYKLLHKLDVRSQQVVDKLIKVMKDIIEDNEQQANDLEIIAASVETNNPENFETPASPVYSLPDTDREIIESGRLETMPFKEPDLPFIDPTAIIDLSNDDNDKAFSNIANLPLEDALSGLTLNDITSAIGETNVRIVNDIYSQSILSEYNIDSQEDDTNFMEIIECGQGFNEYEKAFHCVDSKKIKENRNEPLRTHEPINSNNNDKEKKGTNASVTTKKLPRKRKLPKSNLDVVGDFSKSKDSPKAIKKRNAKQSKIPKKFKQTLKPLIREKINEKVQKGKAETKGNVINIETNKIVLPTTAISEKPSENAVTNTKDNIILGNTKLVHNNLLRNKSFIDTIDLSWIEGLKYVRVIDKEEYSTNLNFEDSIWDNLEYPSNWDDIEFEI